MNTALVLTSFLSLALAVPWPQSEFDVIVNDSLNIATKLIESSYS